MQPDAHRRHAAARATQRRLAGLLLLASVGVGTQALAAPCPPQGWTPSSLSALKARSFQVADARERMVLAEGLLPCLADPDPALRDGIAYEALSHWMRAGDLNPDALRNLRGRLDAMLDGDDPGGDISGGFAKPFAALTLAEIARTDRMQSWMTPPERMQMVARATGYLQSVQDYRGYDDTQGWRHGIAHGADWLMQLSLNPALSRAQLDDILAAIASQAVPESGHAYVFGEPERLARPVLLVAARGLHSQEDWQGWFAALPARMGDPDKAWKDRAWLARRHDLVAFLSSLYLQVDGSSDTRIAALQPAIANTLKQLH